MNKITIFCIPFAGGTKYSYADFQEKCPPNIDLIPLDLPGRGQRIAEAYLSEIDRMAEDVLAAIKDKIDQPFAIYGHSLGAMIGFVLCQKLAAHKLPPPLRLFVSGRPAPSKPRRKPMIHHLPKIDFFLSLKELGGMPELMMQNQELLEFFEPLLKADLKAAETYKYRPSPAFEFPITVMIGDEEDILEEEKQGWQKETVHPLKVHEFTGNHFFILKHSQEIVDIIAEEVGQLAASDKD